jgi:hypothetical protein
MTSNAPTCHCSRQLNCVVVLELPEHMHDSSNGSIRPVKQILQLHISPTRATVSTGSISMAGLSKVGNIRVKNLGLLRPFENVTDDNSSIVSRVFQNVFFSF